MQNQIQSDAQYSADYNDEIDLRELFAVLWAGRNLVISVTSLFAIVAVIIALTLPNEYKATAIIAPAQSNNGSMLGGMASQFGGLASLAGINIGGEQGGETLEAMEIMQSWGFIKAFINKNNLAVELFAVDGWDRGANQLSIDRELYDINTKQWVRSPPSGKSIEPTSWELYKHFSQRLSVSSDKKTGLVSVSIEFFSPLVAKEWVDLFVVAINTHMRERKLEQVNSNIQYLKAQIEKTAIADMHEVFYQIIEGQIKNKMLAEASPEYAFTTVSPAMQPEEKSKPKRALICILATLLGGLLAVLVVLIRHYSAKR